MREQTSPRPVLIVPGWTNSGPDHWQSHWERAHPNFRRVEQRDWEDPDPAEWIQTLDAAVAACATPPVLVAHSLGCIAVVRWALGRPSAPAAAAFLVAPADVEREGAPAAIRPFAPVPLEPLSFPSMVVASSDDPYLAFARAQQFARDWGSELVDAGKRGHLNAAAGLGPWPEGEKYLGALVERVA